MTGKHFKRFTVDVLAKLYYKRMHKKLATNNNLLTFSLAKIYILAQPARRFKTKWKRDLLQ